MVTLLGHGQEERLLDAKPGLARIASASLAMKEKVSK